MNDTSGHAHSFMNDPSGHAHSFTRFYDPGTMGTELSLKNGEKEAFSPGFWAPMVLKNTLCALY